MIASMIRARRWIAAVAATLMVAAASAEPAPDFSLPVLGGSDRVQLADYRGQVVYVDFWASWCGPCAVSLPQLEQLRQQFNAQGFEVLAINLDASEADASRFLRSRSITYPILFDQQQSTPSRFGVKGMPTAFLIDRSGRLRHTHTGFKKNDAEKLGKLIQQLLTEEPS